MQWASTSLLAVVREKKTFSKNWKSWTESRIIESDICFLYFCKKNILRVTCKACSGLIWCICSITRASHGAFDSSGRIKNRISTSNVCYTRIQNQPYCCLMLYLNRALVPRDKFRSFSVPWKVYLEHSFRHTQNFCFRCFWIRKHGEKPNEKNWFVWSRNNGKPNIMDIDTSER